MKRTLLGIVALILAGLTLTANPASASVLGPTWSHTPGQQPYVQVEDHTGYDWPVTSATRAWNFGLHYARCTSSRCVRVYETNMGRNGIIGYTRYSYNTATNRFVAINITMNSAYRGLSYAQRYQATAQELGHSLGLGHDPYRDVMYAHDRGYTTISQYERNELTQAYSH